MKVLIYGSSPYFVNLPDINKDNNSQKSIDLTLENIGNLILVKEDARVKEFLLALLNLRLSLTVHIVMRKNSFGSLLINYIFTYQKPDNSLFVIGMKETGNNYFSLHLFSESIEKSFSEQYWSEYFLNILQKLKNDQVKARDYSSFVVDALEKSGLSA